MDHKLPGAWTGAPVDHFSDKLRRALIARARGQSPGSSTSVVLATTLLATLFVVLGNLFADLALAWADPRVRLRDGGLR